MAKGEWIQGYKKGPTDDIYILTVSDGQQTRNIQIPKRELKRMIAQSLWDTVIASSRIEGENVEGLVMPEKCIDDVPDSMLTTED